MINNIVLGPICCYRNEVHCKQLIKELFTENWLPLYRLTKGKLLADLIAQTPINLQEQTKGLVIMVGYRKLYEA